MMTTTRNFWEKHYSCEYYLITQALELGSLKSPIILDLPYLNLNFLIIKVGTEVLISWS